MDDDRAPHWTWLVAGAVVVLVLAPRPTRKSIRSLAHRFRAAVGMRLIDIGNRMLPPLPWLDDADAKAKRRQRARAAMAAGRERAARRNGCAGKGEAGPI